MSDKDAHNIAICHAVHAETRERDNHAFAGIIEDHLMVCRPAEEEIGTEAVFVSVCVISRTTPAGQQTVALLRTTISRSASGWWNVADCADHRRS